MTRPFIVYLKNRTSPEFEYKRDVSRVACTDKGYRVTFNSGKTYNYGADKVQDYPLLSTRQDVCVYVKQNILTSLKSLYGNNIKSVLLKEYYRCHPTIIRFCNKKKMNYKDDLAIVS